MLPALQSRFISTFLPALSFWQQFEAFSMSNGLSVKLHLYVHVRIQSILIIDHFKVNQLSAQKVIPMNLKWGLSLNIYFLSFLLPQQGCIYCNHSWIQMTQIKQTKLNGLFKAKWAVYSEGTTGETSGTENCFVKKSWIRSRIKEGKDDNLTFRQTNKVLILNSVNKVYMFGNLVDKMQETHNTNSPKINIFPFYL